MKVNLIKAGILFLLMGMLCPVHAQGKSELEGTWVLESVSVGISDRARSLQETKILQPGENLFYPEKIEIKKNIIIFHYAIDNQSVQQEYRLETGQLIVKDDIVQNRKETGETHIYNYELKDSVLELENSREFEAPIGKVTQIERLYFKRSK